MRRNTTLLFILFLSFSASCRSVVINGSGVSRTEDRSIGDFDEIELRGAGRLDAEIGPLAPVSVTTDDNLLPLIETTLKGRTLVIQERETMQPRAGLRFRVTAPNIKRLEISGAGSVNLIGIKNDALAIHLTGAGEVAASGRTDNLEIHLNGVGNLKAYGLAAKKVTATLNGTGKAEIDAIESLKASVSGIGSISYLGDAKVESHVSGLGRVSKRG